MTNTFPNLKSEIDKIEIPEERLQQSINMAILKGRKAKNKPVRRFTYLAISIAVAFLLFIGSAFVSPTMAKIAAKVPFLGVMFDTRPIYVIIFDELSQKGYQITGAGGGHGEIEVRIAGTEDYFNEVKDEISDISNKILEQRGYKTFSVEVVHLNEPPIDMPKEYKEAQIEALQVKEKLEKEYSIFSVNSGYRDGNKFFYIEIPKTEPRGTAIEVAANEALQLMKVTNYSIEVKDRLITPIEFTTNLSELLSVNKELKYKTLTFFAYPEKEGESNQFPDSYEGYEEIALTVYLSIPNSEWNTNKSEKIRAEVKEVIREFYQSKEVAPFLSLPLSDIVVDSYENIEED